MWGGFTCFSLNTCKECYSGGGRYKSGGGHCGGGGGGYCGGAAGGCDGGGVC